MRSITSDWVRRNWRWTIYVLVHTAAMHLWYNNHHRIWAEPAVVDGTSHDGVEIQIDLPIRAAHPQLRSPGRR